MPRESQQVLAVLVHLDHFRPRRLRGITSVISLLEQWHPLIQLSQFDLWWPLLDAVPVPEEMIPPREHGVQNIMTVAVKVHLTVVMKDAHRVRASHTVSSLGRAVNAETLRRNRCR